VSAGSQPEAAAPLAACPHQMSRAPLLWSIARPCGVSSGQPPWLCVGLLAQPPAPAPVAALALRGGSAPSLTQYAIGAATPAGRASPTFQLTSPPCWACCAAGPWPTGAPRRPAPALCCHPHGQHSVAFSRSMGRHARGKWGSALLKDSHTSSPAHLPSCCARCRCAACAASCSHLDQRLMPGDVNPPPPPPPCCTAAAAVSCLTCAATWMRVGAAALQAMMLHSGCALQHGPACWTPAAVASPHPPHSSTSSHPPTPDHPHKRHPPFLWPLLWQGRSLSGCCTLQRRRQRWPRSTAPTFACRRAVPPCCRVGRAMRARCQALPSRCLGLGRVSAVLLGSTTSTGGLHPPSGLDPTPTPFTHAPTTHAPPPPNSPPLSPILPLHTCFSAGAVRNDQDGPQPAACLGQWFAAGAGHQ
jgi:hypothetical protein